MDYLFHWIFNICSIFKLDRVEVTGKTKPVHNWQRYCHYIWRRATIGYANFWSGRMKISFHLIQISEPAGYIYFQVLWPLFYQIIPIWKRQNLYCLKVKRYIAFKFPAVAINEHISLSRILQQVLFFIYSFQFKGL